MMIDQTNTIDKQNRILGTTTAWAVSILLVIYSLVLTLGLLSLKSPQDPIADPYFSIMELLILITAPLMVITMVAVHKYADSDAKIFSMIALIFMVLMAGITSCVHFVVLTVSRQIEVAGFSWASLFFSFKWPSVIYTLDILAWDWFFALSMLFAAPVFKSSSLEKTLRIVMIISGVLSLIGLIGVPFANMNVRNIGIIGYTVVAIVVFFMIGIVFRQKERFGDYYNRLSSK